VFNSGGFESDSIRKLVEGFDDGAVKFVEWTGFDVRNETVLFEGFEDAAG